MTTVWKKLSATGIRKTDSDHDAKKIIVANQLSLLLFLFIVTIAIIDSIHAYFQTPHNYSPYIFVAASVGVFNLFLNKLRLFKISGLIIILVPYLIITILPLLDFQAIAENYFWFPYLCIPFSVITQLVFPEKDDLPISIPLFLLLITGSVFSFELINFFDSSNTVIIGIIKEHLLFYKIVPVAILLFINIVIWYFRKENNRYEQKLTTILDEQKVQNHKVYQQAAEIEENNQMLQIKNEEIAAQNEELTQQQEQLHAQNDMLEVTVSELKNAQEKLIEAEKMASLGTLTAGIAHEINNPISFINAGIKGLKTSVDEILAIIEQYQQLDESNYKVKIDYINKMVEDTQLPMQMELIRKVLRDVEEGTNRTTEIIRGLRLFSKMDRENKEKVLINDQLDSTLVLLKNKWKNHIIIKKDYDQLVVFNGFPSKLNQVWMNLLINAIDAIDEKRYTVEYEPEIKLITKNEKDHIEVIIEDNGCGIKKDLLKNIYEPFFSTKGAGKGVGLGLSISYGIIQDHEGKIEVKSEEGKFCRFKVTLPV